MDKEQDGTVYIKGIYSHVLTGAVCAALSFGISQLWGTQSLKETAIVPMQEQMRVMAKDVEHLQISDGEQRALIAADRADFTTRIQVAVGLVTSVLDNQKELIALIKAQNQIK